VLEREVIVKSGKIRVKIAGSDSRVTAHRVLAAVNAARLSQRAGESLPVVTLALKSVDAFTQA